VSRLTKARPTVGETPRDSVTAHMISWASIRATVEALVFGRAISGLAVLRPVRGRKVVFADVLANVEHDIGV